VKKIGKFCALWKAEGSIDAGTEILFTWVNNRFYITINGEVRKVFKSNELAKLIFRTYLTKDSVNVDTSTFIRNNWYRQYSIEKDGRQQWLRRYERIPQEETEVTCVLKGNNKDTYCTINIQHQNKEYIKGHKPYFFWDEDEDEDIDFDEDEDEELHYQWKESIGLQILRGDGGGGGSNMPRY